MSKENKKETEAQEEVYQSILGDEFPTEDESDSEQAEAENKPVKDKASKKKVLKIVGISAASVAIVGALTVGGIMLYNKTRPQIAASSPNYEIDTKMVACYYHDVIQMFVDSYGQEELLNSYNMDITKPLKEQQNMFDEGSTWFDMMIDQVQGTIEQQLIMYEAAKAAGFEIPEAEQKMIDEALAEANPADYGNGVTKADIKKVLEIQALSTSYYMHLTEELKPSAEEIQEYYDANTKYFMNCGVAGFSIPYNSGEEGDTEEMTKEKAKELVDDLLASKSAKEFEEKVAHVLTEYEGYDQEKLDANLPSIYNEGFTYSAENPLAEWAFGGAKKNDTFKIEDNNIYYVYFMTSDPVKDETKTVDVRHILFMEQEDNMKAAEDALNEWKNGEMTENSFAELANKYSEDPGSNTTGGLYEGVYPGQMVATFNNWCFDESRKPGDTGLVQSDYGVHVMYFVEESGPMWEVQISSTLGNAAYETWYSENSPLYPVTFDDAVLNSIDG
ncbi:MAG: peptidylprolyl isomerase [Oscillospiraceae bacterium]|nr:peptidylprolyl isomerase [Oscillospiraceae bacterium]